MGRRKFTITAQSAAATAIAPSDSWQLNMLDQLQINSCRVPALETSTLLDQSRQNPLRNLTQRAGGFYVDHQRGPAAWPGTSPRVMVRWTLMADNLFGTTARPSTVAPRSRAGRASLGAVETVVTVRKRSVLVVVRLLCRSLSGLPPRPRLGSATPGTPVRRGRALPAG